MNYFVAANIFLRYLTNDIPEQAEAVALLLKKAAAGELRLVSDVMVMAELVWVMEAAYRLPRSLIQEYILIIINTPGLSIPRADIIIQAITWYAEKNVDFIDAYHAVWMISEEISQIFTFDHKHFHRFGELNALLPPGQMWASSPLLSSVFRLPFSPFATLTPTSYSHPEVNL